MSERVIDAEALGQLTEQLWRRLGLTQTFDKMLVTEAAVRPAAPEALSASIAGRLNGGAVKFWEMSFPKLCKDLERRQFVAETDGVLGLHEDFRSRVARVIDEMESGSSKVAPTPGVTLAEVLKKVKAREAKSAKPVRSRAKRKPPVAKTAAPKKRPGKAPAADVAPPAAEPAAAAPGRPAVADTPLNKIFTTIKLNKLLDALDNSQSLFRNQLGTRLQLGKRDLDRFLAVTDSVDLTRVTRDDMVSLHWKGQELSRTASADRRMALVELVKTLRTQGEELEV